jgi:uncharacterized protein YpmB
MADTCGKEKEALAAAQKELKQTRFKWTMITVGLSILVFLLLISTFYFWWQTRSEAVAPVSQAAPAAPAAQVSQVSQLSSAAPDTSSLSPELR